MKIRIYSDKPTEYYNKTQEKFIPVIGNIVTLKENGFYELEVNAKSRTKSRRLLDTPLAI